MVHGELRAVAHSLAVFVLLLRALSEVSSYEAHDEAPKVYELIDEREYAANSKANGKPGKPLAFACHLGSYHAYQGIACT
jgi:hypothetical protein